MPPKRPRNQTHFATDKQQATSIQWASPQQEEAFRWGPTPLCLSGGFGSAKTWALCLKALYISDLYPQNRGVIARKVGKELDATTRKTFFKICPPAAYDPRFGGRRADSENILRLARSGSEILWIHLDDDDIEGLIRGLEINWFLIDQAEEIEEELFDMLSSRLGRWDQAIVPDNVLERNGGVDKWEWKSPMGKPIPPVYSMIAVNPGGYDHWIYRRFHEDSQDWKDKYSELGYKMITMRSTDNRFLPKQNLDEMLRKDESFQRRFVRGEWGIPEGQIHNVEDASIINAKNYPTLDTRAVVRSLVQKCTLHRVMDHGDAAPTCCTWWAVDEEGNVFCYREYYKPNAMISVHRRNITELSGQERYAQNLADPSIFHKTQQKYGGKYSVSDDYEDRNTAHGFRPDDALYWSAADNDELGTRNIINEYLRLQGTGQQWKQPEPPALAGAQVAQFERTHEEPRIHPLTRELGYWPRLFFIEKCSEHEWGCRESVTQTRSQRRDRIGTENGRPIFNDERDEKVVDHAYDTVRYFLASRAARPRVVPREASKWTFNGQVRLRERMMQEKRIARAMISR